LLGGYVLRLSLLSLSLLSLLNADMGRNPVSYMRHRAVSVARADVEFVKRWRRIVLGFERVAPHPNRVDDADAIFLQPDQI
jgi:hypothetical protein